MDRRSIVLALALLGLLGTVAAVPLPASASSHVATVAVTIERVTALSCLETGYSFGGGESSTTLCSSEADFYPVISIGGSSANFRHRAEALTLANRNDIRPNWVFSSQPQWTERSIPVRIQMWERDGNGDDLVDLTASSDRDLALGVDLAPCFVSGSVNGMGFARGGCGVTLSSQGSSYDRASIQFRITVSPTRISPPASLGGRVRCTHSPVWPQAGQQVTITAESLSLSLQPRLPLRLEIYVGFGLAKAGEAATITHTQAFNSSFTYLCRVLDESINVMSAAHEVHVGPAPSSGAVPILRTATRARSIDITFIADQDDYTSASDPDFLTDVGNTIRNAFFGEDILLRNDRNGGGFSFWIVTTMGDADPPPPTVPPAPPAICPVVNFPATSWAESQMLVHLDRFRDCAFGAGFTSSPGSPRVVLHEAGHRPFGLADEYCPPCDGGYWQPAPFPNVFANRNPGIEDCEADAAANGRSACRTWTHLSGSDWFTHDTGRPDLMWNNQAPQLLDIRRINWVFQSCRFRNACSGR